MNFETALRSNAVWLPENDLPAGRWDTRQAALPPPVPFRMQCALFGSAGIAQVILFHTC